MRSEEIGADIDESSSEKQSLPIGRIIIATLIGGALIVAASYQSYVLAAVIFFIFTVVILLYSLIYSRAAQKDNISYFEQSPTKRSFSTFFLFQTHLHTKAVVGAKLDADRAKSEAKASSTSLDLNDGSSDKISPELQLKNKSSELELS